MTVLLAIIAGLGLGYILERGDLCFHSTIRGLMQKPKELDLFRAYIFILIVAAPLVWVLQRLNMITPWIPPFAWQANVFGGLIFGIGMVVAATCITGLFYKLGHGMLGTLVALVAWAIADIIIYRGPLSPLRDSLRRAEIQADGQSATVLNLFGPVGLVIFGLIILGAVWWLFRSPRPSRGEYWGWVRLGLAAGLFTSVAWLLAKAGGSDYTYGTSSVPSNTLAFLLGESTGGSPWIPVALISLIPGAFVAAWRSKTLWVRGETWFRYFELATGGFLMGIGAGIAGGCNLGHSLVGVPLLSLGSITTTISMVLGVWLADRAVRQWRQSAVRVQTVESGG